MFETLKPPVDPEDCGPEGPEGYDDDLIVLSDADRWAIEQAWQAMEAEQAGMQRISEVDDLDADRALARVEAGQRTINLAQAEQLALAAHWADLHGVVTFAKSVRGGEILVRPGGEGTPQVAEFCRVELAAVLGVSQVSAGSLIADALDLRHRLPALWTRVRTGEVKVWVAHKVAARTRKLSKDAAATVGPEGRAARRHGAVRPAGEGARRRHPARRPRAGRHRHPGGSRRAGCLDRS